ncbi:dynamin family protein [Acetobacter malorum]|uniref:dynamin family protein n=1 Tax=Acetobacter malorum TaxID=178901 RepID=UPI000776CF91|nr:dynamin family protein [Acetobacter malorum]
MNLHSYQNAKYRLADIVRALPWRAETALRNRQLFERLAMDRFNVAVVGRYSRGKSTLLNAMIGGACLPMGVEPLTSVITSIAYGSEEKVVAHFRGTSLIEDIPLSRLPDYVTEHGNPGNRRRIEEAEILIPATILRSGFRFIDTPGLGSIVRANTETTRAFLDEIDLFVFVSSCDAPLDPEERDILLDVARVGKPLFPVLNKVDLVASEETFRKESTLKEALDRLGCTAVHDVIPLSAQNALIARASGDDAALERSGVPALEEALTLFLLRERRGSFLRGMCDRVAEVVRQDAPEIEGTLLDRIAVIRQEIGAEDREPETTGAADEKTNVPIPPCAACVAAEQAVFRDLTVLQSRLRAREKDRQDFLRGGGLCPVHARAFGQLAAPREICTAYAPLLQAEAARLRERAEHDAFGATHGKTVCPACAVAARAAGNCLDALARAMEQDRLAVPKAAGLCGVHFELLLARVQRPEIRRALLRRQADDLERRADDMNRFALKQDAARRDAMTQAEQRAARAGLDQWIGLADAWCATEHEAASSDVLTGRDDASR